MFRSRVGVTSHSQRLQNAARASSSTVQCKRRMTVTAVSAQPAAKAVDAEKATTDPLLLRTARGEVSLVICYKCNNDSTCLTCEDYSYMACAGVDYCSTGVFATRCKY